MESQKRRRLLQSMFLMPFMNPAQLKDTFVAFKKGSSLSHRFKLSLNAYSFNGPLTQKLITIEEVIDFCGDLHLDAIDLTGYYLENYPSIPSDEYLYRIKNKIHKAGLSISGTGIRNDFGNPDPAVRLKEEEFVKSWINVAAKLGAPVIRIYSAKKIPDGHSWEEAAQWIINNFASCVAYGKKMGVIVAMQNHNDFITTADQAIYFTEKLDKDWFGLVVDTGNFQTHDAYNEIEKVANYAVNWQVKELVTIKGLTQPMDLPKLMKIIAASDYKGYIPTETLSPGDPKVILPPFLQKVHAAIVPYM